MVVDVVGSLQAISQCQTSYVALSISSDEVAVIHENVQASKSKLDITSEDNDDSDQC